jgi:hypothetical protein
MCRALLARKCGVLCVSRIELTSVDSRVKTLTFLNRAASKEEIRTSGVTVAALFFGKVFGTEAQRALSTIVALRWVGFQ